MHEKKQQQQPEEQQIVKRRLNPIEWMKSIMNYDAYMLLQCCNQ